MASTASATLSAPPPRATDSSLVRNRPKMSDVVARLSSSTAASRAKTSPPVEPRARKLGIEPSYKGDLPTRGSSLRGTSGSGSEDSTSPSPPSSTSRNRPMSHPLAPGEVKHSALTKPSDNNNSDQSMETKPTIATPTRSVQRRSSLAEAGVKSLRLKSPLAGAHTAPSSRSVTPKPPSRPSFSAQTTASSSRAATPTSSKPAASSSQLAPPATSASRTTTPTTATAARRLSSRPSLAQAAGAGLKSSTAEKPRVASSVPKKVPPRSSSITERSASLPRVSKDTLDVRKKLAEMEEKLRKSDARISKLLTQQKTQLKTLPRTVVAEGDKDSLIASLQEKVADLELELENAEYCESTNHAETFMPMINDLQVQLTAARKENQRVREQLETVRASSRQTCSSTANNDDDEEEYKVPDLAQSEAIRYSNHVNEEELTSRNFELEAQVNALEQQVESLTSKLELQSLEHETAIAKQAILHKEELEKTELALHARESEMSKLHLELESVQSRMSQLDKDLRRQQTQSLDLKMTLETKAMENDELRRSLIRVAEDNPELDKASNRRSIVMASPAMEGSKW
ncbi:Sarcolemmal membrane-associated protein [Yarrowia sp. C11]|nr:Sarcolemmal membrane-associated protein [Yarrowia sp. C11]KAG5370587.1 Sarcolemmal membrane-associated protein [Yarrowia sp. E02]